MATSVKECAVHLLFFLQLSYLSNGFNLDTVPFLKYANLDPGSYFGYSVALHKPNSNQLTTWAVIGAPLSNCTRDGVCNKEVKQGAVYKCSTTQNNPSCEVIEIDPYGPDTQDFESKQVPVEVKLNQWLGGTVFSTGISKDIVACAPRYVWRDLPISSDTQYYWPIGRCFLIRTDSNNWIKRNTLNPCRYEKQGNNYYGYCEAGMSATSLSGGDTIIMGVPGVANWKGQIAAYDKTYDYTDFTSRDQLSAGNYMGYAVTSGNFLSNSNSEFVGGAPRAADLKGKAIVYQKSQDYTLKITNVLEGQDQIGSYFGSSLCAVNVNGDSRSDLLVGAPYFSVVKDEGRVFVYINNNGAMDLMRGGPLVGDNIPGAKFGLAMAAIGDVNQDGYDDVAIGAPYQDNGVVFIYHGYNNGVRRKYSQKFKAEDEFQAFGSSLSGGIDVDDNGYPDLLVGAYETDNAMLIKSKAVIDVTPSITLSKDIIDVNETSCGGNACLTVTVCFEYRGKNINPKKQEVEYTLALEKDRTKDGLKSRVYFPGAGKSTTDTKKITMDGPNLEKCDSPFTVHVEQVKDKSYDLWTPVTFDVSFKLTSTDPSAPVLNAYLPSTVRKEASFQRNCGTDNKCEPDLQLSADVVFPDDETELRLGKVKEMTVDISVQNKGEDAYLSKVNLQFPKDLLFAGAVDKTGTILCSTSEVSNTIELVTCDIGNPMKQNDKKVFGLKFSTTGVTGQQQTLTLDVEATSSNKDPPGKRSDNTKKIVIDVKLEADLTIFGVSTPDQITYKGDFHSMNDTGSEDLIGPEVFFTVTVKNEGPSTVEKSLAEISIPSKLDLKDPESYLFYLLPELVVTGSGSCEGLKLNPLNINLTNTDQESVVKRSRRQTETKWDCRTASCRTIKCNIGRLEKGQQTIIRIRSRIWQSTLLKRDPGLVKLITVAKITAPDIKLLSQPENHKPDKVEIVTRANPAESDVGEKTTPIWIIVVAALGGVLLLALAIFGMYKLGFFKRNKPPKDISGPVPEAEPMKV